MAHKSLFPEAVGEYVVAHSRETSVQHELREETRHRPESRMQISADQGAFMALFVKVLGAKRCLEIGTFTGYSALSVALAIPADGTIVACDVSTTWTDVARDHWVRAGVSHKIDLRIGEGKDTLDALIASGQRGSFDFAFVDADKTGYPAYYEQCLELLRPGGVVAFDNMLWHGEVVRPSTDEETTALRTLNDIVHADPRVDASLVTIGDGLLLARKR
jgi:predicted O-methyltransferase YrrM